ncbi:hypothetical protein [Curtobacterium sp. 9128]|uniref:CBU_0592 family membrane protein n=1 Tax=Curtobacterium sp. 9128 TaxID=1793722 RepID=UPI00119E8A28|nr:hypothetical protein [Curtobacterium sp. 9128]
MAGYILFSTGKLPNGPVYQLFNLVGGLAVAVNVAAHGAVPSTIVNGIWAIVAVVVLVRMAKARRGAERAGLETAAELSPEPLATTAVLPVVGPALRQHEADPGAPVLVATATGTDVPDPAPSLQAGVADATGGTGTTDVARRADAARPADTTDAARPTGASVAPEPVAPITASVPVITATIAIALVGAAQEQRRAERDAQEQQAQQAR